ncbi:MAG: hypothetical protein AB7O04_06035 [Hyphomonadaceae bacterium]
MSLNKTLDRLFDEIRKEARRNPDFANRLDAVLRSHASRRDVPDDALIEAEETQVESPPKAAEEKPRPEDKIEKAPQAAAPNLNLPGINPVGLLQKAGEDALEEALISQNRDALLALIAEHNLDPVGEVQKLDREALQAHVVAQAKRRIERDKKMFDY